MECLQNVKNVKQRSKQNELNWRFNHIFSDHNRRLLLYGRVRFVLVTYNFGYQQGKQN